MKQRMESTQREKLMRGRADWKVKHEVRVEAGYLESFVRELFEKAGMERGDAQFHAEALVQTDLWGISSHGCMRVPAYFERMRNGAINVRPNVRKVSGEGAFEVLDADAGAGFIAGKRAMERAVELAKKYHIAAVGVRNSNHFGAGGFKAGDREQSHSRRNSHLWGLSFLSGYGALEGGRGETDSGDQERGKNSHGLGHG